VQWDPRYGGPPEQRDPGVGPPVRGTPSAVGPPVQRTPGAAGPRCGTPSRRRGHAGRPLSAVLKRWRGSGWAGEGESGAKPGAGPGQGSRGPVLPLGCAPRSGVPPHRPEGAQRDAVGQDGHQVGPEEQDVQHVAHLEPLAGGVAELLALLQEPADGGDLPQHAVRQRRALRLARAPRRFALPGVLAAVVVQLGCGVERRKREKPR